MTSLKPLSIALFLGSASLLASGCSSNSVPLSEPVAQSAPTPPASPISISDSEPLAMSEYQADDSEDSKADLIANMEVNANDIDPILALDEPEESTPLALEDPVETSDEASAPTGHPGDTLFKFGFDKKELDESSVAKIEKHGEFLLQHPGVRITINGHADSQGDATYNEQLSLQRAQYVASILQEKGVKQEQIEIFSWGAADPRADAKHPRDNRRVELIYGDEYLAKTAF
ncbi:OmpA family protein [Ketobacter nezhaii]|uniref:OmpA family protein n=1 Tax=Ketobacter sp. MCCC 1A13808 TaxID=2602738 RepID=UPI0018DECB16|nr:OmpA family protein [Ketobacter sp. MCCC 1A13808]